MIHSDVIVQDPPTLALTVNVKDQCVGLKGMWVNTLLPSSSAHMHLGEPTVATTNVGEVIIGSVDAISPGAMMFYFL